MKFSASQPELRRGLDIVTRAVAGRTTMPILSNIPLSVKGNRLTLRATDLAMALTFYVIVDSSEDGDITVPAKEFSEIVGALSASQKVVVSLNDKNKTVSIQSGGFKGNLKGVDAEEFPLIPDAGEGEFSLNATVLKRAIDAVAFCIGSGDSRPMVGAFNMVISDNTLTVHGFNGTGLAGEYIVHGVTDAIVTANIPVKAMAELSRLLNGGEVGVTITPNQVIFSYNGVELVSQVIDGQYMNTEPMFATNNPITAAVDKREMLQALKIVNVFSRDASNLVTLHGSTDCTLQVSSRADRGDADPVIPAAIDGGEFSVSLNGKVFQDVVNAITGDVVVSIKDAKSPLMVTDSADNGLKYVVLPMFSGAR